MEYQIRDTLRRKRSEVAILSYQDKWICGQQVQSGYRECAERYATIKGFCEQFNRPFTVCDIGANWCYFGLRLTEDFPDCTVIAIEPDHYQLRLQHLKKNKSERILLLNHRVSIGDIRLLSRCFRFDLVMALSILHHLPGSTAEWIDVLRSLGDNLIVEMAMKDSARVKGSKECTIPEDATLLDFGISHLNSDILRPIFLLRKANAFQT